ncbi:MAG: VTT domain-containing protein [Turicibacter sp.]|nr:VTT domain-containing protein [Turicibacter sp.]
MEWLHTHRKWLHICLIVIASALVIPRLDYFSVEAIVNFSPDSLWLAASLFLAIYVIKALVMLIPISLLYVAAGIVFPLVWAFVVTYLCLIVALSIGYLNGKSLGEDNLSKLLTKQKKFAELLEARKANLPLFASMARIFRLQFDLTNMICGALNMNFIKFLTASLLGVSPVVVPYIIASAHIGNPTSMNFWIPFSISLLVSLVAFVIYTISKKTNKKRVAN